MGRHRDRGLLWSRGGRADRSLLAVPRVGSRRGALPGRTPVRLARGREVAWTDARAVWPASNNQPGAVCPPASLRRRALWNLAQPGPESCVGAPRAGGPVLDRRTVWATYRPPCVTPRDFHPRGVLRIEHSRGETGGAGAPR